MRASTDSSDNGSTDQYIGTDNVQRAFSPEHIAVLEAAFNRPQGNESVTSVVINGSSYIAGRTPTAAAATY